MSGLHALRGLLSSYLDDIRRHLKPDMKVTLVIRDPGDVENVIVIGNDEWAEVIAAIERLRAKEGAET